MPGFHFCTWVFSSSLSGNIFLVVQRLLVALASLVVENRLQSTNSVVVEYRFSFPLARELFLDQRSNLCSLH